MVNKTFLISDYIADLRVDIRCAHRDGLTQYAIERQKELEHLLAKINDGEKVQINSHGIPH